MCLVLGLSATLSAQQVDHWWLPQEHSRQRYGVKTLHEYDGGIAFVALKDSFQRIEYETTDSRGYLSLHRIGPDGVLHSDAVREIGPYRSHTFGSEGGTFEYALGKTGSGGLLLATTYWDWFAGCLGGSFHSAGTLQLEVYWNDGSRLLGEFDSSRHPVLLGTRSGDAWLAWETVSLIEQPEDSLDGRYRAEIHAVRISPDNALHDHQVLGEGYEPRLVERGDGAVFLLRRIAEHSASPGGNGLLLRRIDGTGGGDVLLEEGISVFPRSGFELLAVAGADGGIHATWHFSDSVEYFSCAADMTVLRSGPVLAGSSPPLALLTDAAGDPLLLWRERYHDDLRWSPSRQGRMFDTIHSIAGTDTLNQWTAQRGGDGYIKLIGYDREAAQLRLFPNATSDAPVSRVLFAPTEPWGSAEQWLLTDDRTLWVAHQLVGDSGESRIGLYRITDISLDAETPPVPVREFALPVNYPNPFNSTTTILFTLPRSMPVTLMVTDMLGREVRRIVDGGVYEAGMHAFRFDATGLPPGMYFTRLTADGISAQRKLLLRR